jgi:biotin transport system substrate-specific component
VSAAASNVTRQATDVASIAVFAALIVALGAIYIPLPFSPVPVTGQTLGILMAANVLGPKRGTASVALFLLLVAAGMPVLAGGRGGAALFIGPSGGYLVGFLLAAVAVGLLTSRLGTGRRDLSVRIAINVTAGVALVYALGVPWLAIAADRPLVEALTVGALTFLPGDVFKAVVASVVADRVLVAGQRAGLGVGREPALARAPSPQPSPTRGEGVRGAGGEGGTP